MNTLNITFGTIKKAGRDNTSNQKYAEKADITVEGSKEGKNRRVLFNMKAMDLLNLPEGSTQNLIFGFIEADELMNRRLLIANADSLENKSETVVYNTSKNKVSYESKEKGKSITSAPLHAEINSFLEIDTNIDHEYELVFFGDGGSEMDLYELVKIKTDEDNQSVNDLIVNEEEVLEEDQKEEVVMDVFRDYPEQEIYNESISAE